MTRKASGVAVIVAVAALVAIRSAGCASALHQPRSVDKLGGSAQGRSADDLLRDADAAWTQRTQPGKAQAAQELYLDAAAADDRRVDGLLGAMRALTYRIENEKGAPKEELSVKEVELGQHCQRRQPQNAECDYRLAIALGQQAREKTSTGKDALGHIVDLLHKAIAAKPDLESGGPHRVLALVLLRAPSWPVGPGDSEAGLDEAKAAVKLFPNAADNQLALGEALAANNARAEAHAAYSRALALATSAHATGDVEAARTINDAKAGVEKTAGP